MARSFLSKCSIFFIFVFIFISCTKMNVNPEQNKSAGLLELGSQTNGISDPPFTPHDDDSIERITVLGAQEPNPYLIPNMQQAYKDLGYNPNMATVTNLYVRFKPTVAQVAMLDSIMDAQGLDVFDTPMDYDVTYEGDYYQDPSIPDSLPTWQYAVVPPNFSFPSGITYQTLAQIHIPADAYTAIETEAENIAGGSGNNAVVNGGAQTSSTAQPNTPQCTPGYHWDFDSRMCVPNNCPAGYQWNGTTCVPITCPNGQYFNGTSCVPYNTTPPAQAPDAQIPAGKITVYDTQLSASQMPSDGKPIRKARMVARRWFKVDHVYTDDYGNFAFTKRYKHKVRVLIKFKNDYASIRAMRGVRVWQMLFPVKKEIGIFSGDKSNIVYNAGLVKTAVSIFGGAPVDITASNKSTRYWVAATTLNAVQEYRDYATSFQIALPPTGLKIFLSNLGQADEAATPLYAKRRSDNLGQTYLNFFAGSYPPPFSVLYEVLKHQIDIIGSYNFSSYSYFFSDDFKETYYHELTHAGEYTALGDAWYKTFVTAEENEINLTGITDPHAAPYGRGTDANGPIIALGESWAYHMGQYMADQKYMVNSSAAGEQFTKYANGYVSGLNSHLIALENYDPHLAGYVFDWIPKGLYYDLIDTRDDLTANPRYVTIDDQVNQSTNFYTNQKLFNALNSGITTMSAYKQNLLQQNGNNQSTQVISLFSQYDY